MINRVTRTIHLLHPMSWPSIWDRAKETAHIARQLKGDGALEYLKTDLAECRKRLAVAEEAVALLEKEARPVQQEGIGL